MNGTVPARLAPGESRAYRAPKHTVQLTEDRTYKLEIRHGDGSQVAFRAAFNTDLCGRLVAREFSKALDAGLDVAQARIQVRDAVQYEYANEARATYRDAAYLADMDLAIRILMPPAYSDHLDRKLAELADELRAGAR